MTTDEVFIKFLKVFPVSEEDVAGCIFLDVNELLVRLKNKKELIFTYISSNKWSVETRDLYTSKNKNNEKKK